MSAPKSKKITLKSKIGLSLEVIGPGEPIGRTETIRVKRLGDGGIRDLPRSELEQFNDPKKVATALEEATPPTPTPAPASDPAEQPQA